MPSATLGSSRAARGGGAACTPSDGQISRRSSPRVPVVGRLRAIFHASTARQLVRAAAQGVVSGLVTLVSIIFLGFFLGMRHAIDADHVNAVSTIVSR